MAAIKCDPTCNYQARQTFRQQLAYHMNEARSTVLANQDVNGAICQVEDECQGKCHVKARAKGYTVSVAATASDFLTILETIIEPFLMDLLGGGSGNLQALINEILALLPTPIPPPTRAPPPSHARAGATPEETLGLPRPVRRRRASFMGWSLARIGLD